MAESDQEFSSEQAEEVARAHLDGLELSDEIAQRSVEVSHEQVFAVVFRPAEGVRGGPFTVYVGENGQVLAQRFER